MNFTCDSLDYLMSLDGVRKLENPTVDDILNQPRHLFAVGLSRTDQEYIPHFAHSRNMIRYYRLNGDDTLSFKPDLYTTKIIGDMNHKEFTEFVLSNLIHTTPHGTFCGIYHVPDTLKDTIRKRWSTNIFKDECLRLLDNLYAQFQRYLFYSKDLDSKIQNRILKYRKRIENGHQDADNTTRIDYVAFEKRLRSVSKLLVKHLYAVEIGRITSSPATAIVNSITGEVDDENLEKKMLANRIYWYVSLFEWMVNEKESCEPKAPTRIP
jgi:hypothetical protein